MGSQPKMLSASRMAAILGMSEYQTPLDVFQKIKEEMDPGWNAAHGFKLPEEQDSAPLRWGLAFESSIISLAVQERGLEISDREKEFSDGRRTCHIDGMYADGVLHEGKTTTSFSFREKWGEPGTDRVPQSYQIQTQLQMMLAKKEQNIVSVLVFPEPPDSWEKLGWQVGFTDEKKENWLLQNDTKKIGKSVHEWAVVLSDMGYFHQYPIHADKSAQEYITQFSDEFWEKHIVPGIPPDCVTPEDARRLFPAPVGTIVVPDEIAVLFAEKDAINDEIGSKGALPRRKKDIQTQVLDWARKQDSCIDDESRDKTIFRDQLGKKLGQWDGKTFR